MEDNSRGYNLQRKYHQLRGAGELIEVHGGHIVRSTGRKDRHSKVFTAKGPRDRRVRLSAHTAIQFYDVQDRLGYDRPSKAVDWLMQNAKAAIDQLGEPSPCNAPPDQQNAREPSMLEVKTDLPVSYGGNAAGFLPPLDGETSMKSFPVAAVTGSSYENFTPDLLPSASSQAQDLSLSLQSFHEPIFQQAHHHQHSHPDATLHSFFSGTTSLVHGATPVSWPAHGDRILAFNATDALCGGGGGEFAYNVAFAQHNQSQFTQREPLQSSNLSPARAWMDPSAIQQSSFSAAAAAMFLPGGYGGFSGFDIPVRVQGGEAEQGGIDRKPQSAPHQ